MNKRMLSADENSTEKKFAERLRERRAEKGWTQARTAKSLGISAVSYLHYEKGQRVPSLSMIVKIAELYDVSIDYLFGVSQY